MPIALTAPVINGFVRQALLYSGVFTYQIAKGTRSSIDDPRRLGISTPMLGISILEIQSTFVPVVLCTIGKFVPLLQKLTAKSVIPHQYLSNGLEGLGGTRGTAESNLLNRFHA